VNREFLLNILFLIFINLLIKPFFVFGIDLTVQNRVGEDYGLYFALLNLTYVFQILNDFGIQGFNNRNISQHPQLLPKYFPNLLAIKFLLGVTYMTLSMLVAWAALGYSTRALGLFAILLLNQILVQLVFFLRSNISGLGHYRLDSFLSSLDKLLMLFTCGFVLWYNPFSTPFTIETFALAQTAALFLTAIIVFSILRQKADFPIRPSWASNWRAGIPTVIYLFKNSFPYALVILLMFAYARLDAVVLERMLSDGKAHADVYAGAYRLLDMCNMLGYLFATLLLPMFARLLKKEGPAGVRPLVSLSFKLIWSGSITLAAAIFFGRIGLVQLMMPLRASEYRFDTLGILIWVFVPVCVIYIFSTLLTAHQKLMEMNRMFVIGIVLDLSLNFLLIPGYQAKGSAAAALITHVFVAAAMVWLCVKIFPLKPTWRSFLRPLAFAAFVAAADWLIFSQVNPPWTAKWLLALRLILAMFAGLTGMLAFRMIDLKKLRMLK
jgi:O-antigen/teichoic acid export membrane protein